MIGRRSLLKKIFYLIRISIKKDIKEYINAIIYNLILVVALLFAIGKISYINQLNNVLDEINNQKLLRCDIFIEDVKQLELYKQQLERTIDPSAKLLTQYRNTIYTTEDINGDRIVLDFKDYNYIQSIKYNLSKGSCFFPEWDKQGVVQAIIPKSLSKKYKLGKQYDIYLDLINSNNKFIKIEIVGVLENDMMYIMDSDDYIAINKSRILIYDSNGLFEYKNQVSSNDIYSFLFLLDDKVSFSEFVNKLDYGDNIINIVNINEKLENQIQLQNPDIILPTVMAVSILVLLINYNIARNILIFIRDKPIFLIYIRLGCNIKYFIKMFSIIITITLIITLLMGHLIGIISDNINLFYYHINHILLSGIILLSIYAIVYSILILKIRRLYHQWGYKE